MSSAEPAPTQPAAEHTILFDWDLEQFDRMVANCDFDDTVRIALRYLRPGAHVLEAGSGPGHVVAYLQGKGFHMDGVELHAGTVAAMKKLRPSLPLRLGDVSRLETPDNSYDAVLSFGLIEHFKDGPETVLAEHLRVLRPGGVAVISVPALSWLRRLKRGWYFLTAPLRPSLCRPLRRLTGRPPARLNRQGRDGFRFHVNPVRGDFFEYWFRPAEFTALIVAAGFEIVASLPSHQDVALWSDLGEWASRNDRRRFRPTRAGQALSRLLGRDNFSHAFMHTIVARKPEKRP